jgi:hypothetical protein
LVRADDTEIATSQTDFDKMHAIEKVCAVREAILHMHAEMMVKGNPCVWWQTAREIGANKAVKKFTGGRS